MASPVVNPSTQGESKGMPPATNTPWADRGRETTPSPRLASRGLLVSYRQPAPSARALSPRAALVAVANQAGDLVGEPVGVELAGRERLPHCRVEGRPAQRQVG